MFIDFFIINIINIYYIINFICQASDLKGGKYMLNQVVLVGRITNDIEVKGKDGETKTANICIAVPRNYKNQNGEYETDFINVIAWNSVAENTKEFCEKGNLIGVKGRIQTYNNTIQIIAERVTFLQTKKADE